jgi:hypothetical protein
LLDRGIGVYTCRLFGVSDVKPNTRWATVELPWPVPNVMYKPFNVRLNFKTRFGERFGTALSANDGEAFAGPWLRFDGCALE